MILEQSFLQKWLEKLPGFVSHVYLILLFVFSRALFRFGELKYSLVVLRGLFGLNGNQFSNFTTNTLLKNNAFLIVFCVIASTPLIKNSMLKLKAAMGKTRTGSALFAFFEYSVTPVVLLLISTAALVGASYNPFLYFRF